MKKLPRYSYSKLNTFITCPRKYKLKYVDGNYEQADAIHLDIGNLLHKILEIKYRNIIDNIPNDYIKLLDVYKDGISEDTDKDKSKFIKGINEIKNKFGEDKFFEINTKSNLSYEDKMSTFLEYLQSDSIDDDWRPLAVEVPFNFEYDGKAILNGFIDRVDINSEGDLRVVDYKSSNKVFDDKDLKTPLQMLIYALACENIYGKTPIEFKYDMILLGEIQDACSKGFYKRGIKKLNKIIDGIAECEISGNWKPNATPLCHWCEFSNTNPSASFYLQELCEYYSLWTPENKTFKTNKEYDPKDDFEF